MSQSKDGILLELASLLCNLTDQHKISWVKQGEKRYQAEAIGKEFIVWNEGRPIEGHKYGLEVVGVYKLVSVPCLLTASLGRLFMAAQQDGEINLAQLEELLRLLQ